MYSAACSARFAGDDRVGVVIPVFNRRSILLETLPCVLAQTRLPNRLVIVDDGSTDGTPTAAAEWLTEARPAFEWQIIRAPHKSAAAARNLGLEQTRTLPFVAFLDSDDLWPTDFLERGVTRLVGNPRAQAAIADRRYVDAGGQEIDATDCREVVADPVTWFFQFGAGVASCSLLRTDAVLAAGAWSESLESAEDAMLFAQVALAGQWLHLPGAPVAFRMGAAQPRAEEHNLSERRADRHLHWSRVFELIYSRARAVRSERQCAGMRKALAQRWYFAGKQLLALGRRDECRECFARAIHWNPMMFRAWRKLATSGKRSTDAAAAALNFDALSARLAV